MKQEDSNNNARRPPGPRKLRTVIFFIVTFVIGLLFGDYGFIAGHVISEQQAAAIARGHAFEYCLKTFEPTECKELSLAWVSNGTPGPTDGGPFYGNWLSDFSFIKDRKTIHITVGLDRRGQLLQVTDGVLREL